MPSARIVGGWVGWGGEDGLTNVNSTYSTIYSIVFNSFPLSR